MHVCVNVHVWIYAHSICEHTGVILARDARDRGVLGVVVLVGELTVKGVGKAASSSAAFATFSLSSYTHLSTSCQ